MLFSHWLKRLIISHPNKLGSLGKPSNKTNCSIGALEKLCFVTFQLLCSSLTDFWALTHPPEQKDSTSSFLC